MSKKDEPSAKDARLVTDNELQLLVQNYDAIMSGQRPSWMQIMLWSALHELNMRREVDGVLASIPPLKSGRVCHDRYDNGYGF